MDYRAYMKQTEAAADSTGGEVVSLAGGYHGVMLTADGTRVIMALDLDSSSGWAAWREDADGERCCDNNYLELGWPALADLSTNALKAIAAHRC